jgi:hypothetical protein
MDKNKKSQNQASQHPGSMKRQEQKGRPTSERRQNEIPKRNDEQQQGYGDRFPRDTYEGGRENR